MHIQEWGGGRGSQNVLPPSLLRIGLPETDFLGAARNPTAFSSPSSAVTSFPRSHSGTELSSLPHCLFCFFVFFLQNVRCGRTTLRAKEVDPLFWGSHSHYLLRGAERLRPGLGWGRGDGEKKNKTHTPQPPSHLCTFLCSRQLLASYCTSPPWLIFTVG